jgi:hypothetical protein
MLYVYRLIEMSYKCYMAPNGDYYFINKTVSSEVIYGDNLTDFVSD